MNTIDTIRKTGYNGYDMKNVKSTIGYILKKNIFVIVMLILMCPILAVSYSSFVISSDKYNISTMYLSELEYVIRINDEVTNSLVVPAGESEAKIQITTQNLRETSYKLIYQSDENISISYAKDEDLSLGNILDSRTIYLIIENNTDEDKNVIFDIVGGYSTNEAEDIEVPAGYTEIVDSYFKYDYETVAFYVNGNVVDSLDEDSEYSLESYTCTNGVTLTYDKEANSITYSPANKQTKCVLNFTTTQTASQFLITLSNSSEELNKIELITSDIGSSVENTVQYRYQGKDVKNYIKFNNELWRIIGLFDTDGSGSYKLKLVKEDSIGTYYYNKTKTLVNFNDWSSSSLYTYLNSAGQGNYELSSSVTLNEGYLSNINTNNISNEVWFLGNYYKGGNSKNTLQMFTDERTSTNVTTGNILTVSAKVGLLYPSDYGYASSECYNKETLLSEYGSSTCKNSNWLYSDSGKWLLSSSEYSTSDVAAINSDGKVETIFAEGTLLNVHPVIYLNSNVSFDGGSGTKDDPYKIK